MPCLLLINILKRECIKTFWLLVQKYIQLDYDITCRGVSVILEMEQEQLF
jgi:hypothetical protein